MAARKKAPVVPEIPQEETFDPEEAAVGSRIIEFFQNGGADRYRIQIKASQRFTFGPLAPGSGGRGGYGGELCLRIYEGANKENQLAVFPGVTAARDITIPMIKVTRPEGVGSWDMFEKRERQLIFAAFDVITSYGASGNPAENPALQATVTNLTKLVMPLIQKQYPDQVIEENVPLDPFGALVPTKVTIP